MNVLDLEQGTIEWLKWRRDGIGASDIPVIMGTLPTKYKSLYKLWQIKCGLVNEDAPNKAMYHGMQYEPHARQWLSDIMETELMPICIEDEEKSYFRASLDAFDPQNRVVVEIKCPLNENTLKDASECGAVHSYWIDQVLWQMGIAEVEEGFIALWDYRSYECIVIRVQWDESRYLKMREAAEKFWNHVRFGNPPPLSKHDYQSIDNVQLEQLLHEYGKCLDYEKIQKIKKEDLKQKIISFANGKNIECNGHKVYLHSGTVKLDTEQMIADGIDLEKYKLKGDPFYTVKIDSKKIIKFEDIETKEMM